MKEGKNIKYLILAEINKKGLRIKFMDEYDEAKKFADEIFDLSNVFQFCEMSNVEQKLTYFASYQVYGNNVYIGKIKSAVSNGAYSVNVMEIDMNSFQLNTFIKERENNSSVFPFPMYEDKIDKILDLFPQPDFFGELNIFNKPSISIT